jgi:predicted nuclease with RNAse H fold
VTKIFLGVNLAGDEGNTGLAEILETPEGLLYQFPGESWRGHDGLERIAAHSRAADRTAVDQPFSYPAPCMRWFLGQGEPDAGTDPYLWRRTDREMVQRVTYLGIPSIVVQPVGRCSNVWRAVELANLLGLAREAVCAGKGKLIETHPRVAWAVVIASLADRDTAESLVTHYKGASQEDRAKRHQQKENRERMLRLLSDGGALRPRTEAQRDLACKTDDNLDALICAFVAYLAAHTAAERCLPARVAEETVLLEGAAILPSQDWQARLLVKKGAQKTAPDKATPDKATPAAP